MARRKKTSVGGRTLQVIGVLGIGMYLFAGYTQAQYVKGGAQTPRKYHLIINPFLWGYDGETIDDL